MIFLHEINLGAADRSYGVQVAQLAGLPTSVVSRAKDVLAALEKGDREGQTNPSAIVDDLPLFSATALREAPQPDTALEIENIMSDVVPDMLTPREALELVYKLKDTLDS